MSFPVDWDDLDRVSPADFTVHSAPGLLGHRDPWVEQMPAPQRLDADLVAEGHSMPIARVQAMHEESGGRAPAVSAELRATVALFP